MADRREHAVALLHPALRDVLLSSRGSAHELVTIGQYQQLLPAVLSLPVLEPDAAAQLEDELRSSSVAASQGRMVLTQGHGADFPLTTALAGVLAREVLPRLAPLVSPGGSGQDAGEVRLCGESLAYVLRYGGPGHAADHGRVHRCHQDDSDLTLAVCLGAAAGWRGADLTYVLDQPGRPGTPDLDAPECATVRHEHQIGVGVLHGGGVYHMVSPLQSGERFSLVVLAMRDDATWKRTFYSDAHAAYNTQHT